jgi:ankyrin repeat protein
MGLSSVIVQWLVDAGAGNDGVDIDGRSALHHAVLAGNDELMHILLNAKVEMNIKDHSGLTALDLAVQRKNTTAIEYILDTMSTLDKNGNSTLHFVSAIDNLKVIEYILSRMYARRKKKNGKAGSTLASDIVFVDLNVGGLLIQVPKLNQVPKLKFKDVYSMSSEQRVHAFFTATKKSPLLPVNGLNHKGESALHIATERMLLPNVCLLLAYGAAVNIQNNKTGDTPLHYAVAGHWKEGIELLLEKGARRKIANNQGILPRDIAVRSGKRISQLEPSAVSRISQTIRFGFGKDLHTGGSGQPDLTDKVKRSSQMRKQDDEAD